MPAIRCSGQFAPMGVPGFHTVTFTSGAEIPPIFAPDIVNGTPVASPEGPPRLVINPAIAYPDGRTEYDGTGTVNSGVDCPSHAGSAAIHGEVHEGRHL